MKDLIASYAEAKFGKEAAASLPIQTGLRRFVSGYFPEDNKQTESLRAIRDAIESSIRQEKRLRGRARTETEYATHRATRARAGTLTSPRWNIKPYPAAQLGSWVTGGLLGAGLHCVIRQCSSSSCQVWLKEKVALLVF